MVRRDSVLCGVFAVGVALSLASCHAPASKDDKKPVNPKVTAAPPTEGHSLTDPRVGVVVDPYVVAAVFCIDANTNQICDAAEVVSTASDAQGRFAFPVVPPAGASILLKEAGVHVGEAFTGTLATTIPAEAPTKAWVVTPMTTLKTAGWTDEKILDVLHTAGLADLTAADLARDPMDSIPDMGGSEATDASLVVIRASMAVEAFTEITSGYMHLTGTVITPAMFDAVPTSGPTPQELVTRMVTMQKQGLNGGTITAVNQQMAVAPCTLPKMTADVFAEASVAINRMVIPMVIADLFYAPDMTKLNVHAQFLGRAFYFRKQADDTCLGMGMTYGGVKSPASNASTLAEMKTCKSFRIPADKWDTPPSAPSVVTPGYLECVK